MNKRGFTLVELAVVLVIVGLIVGGVLVGKSLIEAATVRKSISEIESIEAAVNTFRLKYSCLPGDCTSATNFFGTDTCPVVAYRTTTPDATCNGDGNTKIYGSSYYTEMWRFWQQLGNAGLLSSKYTGTCGYPSANCSANASIGQAGLNLPRSAFGGDVGFVVQHSESWDTDWGAPLPWTSEYHGNVIILGLANSSVTLAGRAAAITPVQAYAIDIKKDDGNGKTGRVEASSGVHGAFATAGCMNGSGVYNTTNTVGCWLMIQTSFK